MISVITIGSNTYNLCTMPSYPGPSEIELGMSDTVSVFTSPYTNVQQTQQWPGGDAWDATITLPSMYISTAWPWEAFLAELRGKANVFQLGDQRSLNPLGVATGTPLVSTSGTNNLPMTTALNTDGWTGSTGNLLLPGDKIQVGYRLYRVCEAVTSDVDGNATITVWPSLRETPANDTSIILTSPVGLFRLANNRRAIHWSPSQLTTVSFQCTEAR
jgi:hypothetical protein